MKTINYRQFWNLVSKSLQRWTIKTHSPILINISIIIACCRLQWKGTVFTCVGLFTIGLMATGSLLILVTVRSVRILLECFLVRESFFWNPVDCLLIRFQQPCQREGEFKTVGMLWIQNKMDSIFRLLSTYSPNCKFLLPCLGLNCGTINDFQANEWQN